MSLCRGSGSYAIERLCLTPLSGFALIRRESASTTSSRISASRCESGRWGKGTVSIRHAHGNEGSIHTGEVKDISGRSSSENCGSFASVRTKSELNVAHNRESSSERQRSRDKIAVADKNTVDNMTRFVSRRIIEGLELELLQKVSCGT
jgi:hypothetical protein